MAYFLKAGYYRILLINLEEARDDSIDPYARRLSGPVGMRKRASPVPVKAHPAARAISPRRRGRLRWPGASPEVKNSKNNTLWRD